MSQNPDRVAAPTPTQHARFLRASCMHRENLREGQTCGQAFTAECGYCAAATALERAYAVGVAAPTPETWRCFHCDEVFTDKAEAREHFGEMIDDDPLCKIKADEGGLAGEIRRLEAEVLRVCNERNEYENDARLWYESEADRVRRIGHVQWWQEMDSREGEKLVLLERIAELERRVAAPPSPDVTKEVFIRQVKDEALRLQRAYKLSSAAALQEAFHRFEPDSRVAAPTPHPEKAIREAFAEGWSCKEQFHILRHAWEASRAKVAAGAPAAHEERTETVEPLNFHAIVGPNGMCLCGVRADGTVVTCGAVLELEFQKRLAQTPETPSQGENSMSDDTERLSVEDSEAIIQRLAQLREDTTNDKEAAELARLIGRVECRPTPDIYHVAWPDGSIHRERWLLHVWHKVPMDVLAQACIRAKEDTGPHYLMFMEPDGYTPKADFTCWICGRQTPHPHSDAEVSAARKTLEVFHDNVWTHLCEAQARSVQPKEKIDD